MKFEELKEFVRKWESEHTWYEGCTESHFDSEFKQFYENNQPERSKREDSSRMKKLREVGLIGCLNDTGITSDNYKDEMRCSELYGNIERDK